MAILDFSDINTFTGNSKLANMAKKVDEVLSNNEDFVPSFVILGIDIQRETFDNPNLRKVIKAIRDYLSENGGKLEEMPTPGNPKYKSYRYGLGFYGQKKLNRDPFFFHRQVKRKIDGKEAMAKLKEALAFMPKAWIDSFLGETEILVQNEFAMSNGMNIISSEKNILLTGTEYIAELYKAITERKALLISYNSGYKYEIQETFHPHYLKEYNGRWFVCGRTVQDDGTVNDNAILALDRITDIDEHINPIEYEGSDGFNFEDFFSDIIGVTHSDEWPDKVDVILQVNNPKVFNLIKTKKLHHSQTENDAESLITLNLRPNIELKTKVLSFGADVEVLSPKELREQIRREIASLNRLYHPS
ncbi:MAG: WYL domain-containing protein [Bacteroides sp.]|nr:WYL domain-containing protein [Bacteroides sp.]